MSRPRDPGRDAAILDAARRLLDAHGFEALTIEAVAARAGVGRPTIYRRWPTKAHLVLAAFQDATTSPRGSPPGQPADPPDTGSLQGDVRALVSRLVEGFRAMATNGAVGGIAAEMATNPEFADHVRQRWLDPDEEALARIFDRAVERGELSPGVDGAARLGMLAGAVFYRIVILHQDCPPEWQDEFVRLVAG